MTDEERAVEAVIENTDQRVGLTHIPRAVKALEREGWTIDRAHRALLRASELGVIELRVESGLGRLTREQRARCVVIPATRYVDETLLSWARVV